MEIRSKKKVQLWKKAIVHFSLCFVMGFFTGFAPTGKRSMTSPFLSSTAKDTTTFTNYPPQPLTTIHTETTPNSTTTSNVNRTLISENPNLPSMTETSEHQSQSPPQEEDKEAGDLPTRRLVILVTPTDKRSKYGNVLLRRLANTIKLVSPPLLWVVVERKSESEEISEMLRKTGIMYRHLVYKENFTDSRTELDHQRNVALRHLEQHRLSGIVHFAELSNVYDLDFFDGLRSIEVFGTWAMAILAANKQKVVIEGPVCDSSQVIGWHLMKKININDDHGDDEDGVMTPPIHISSFAFNSSILWDPERWGRPSSGQQTSQNSIKFVKQVVLEDEAKLKGIPPEDCSRIMLWTLNLPAATPDRDHSQKTDNSDNSQRQTKTKILA